jgi:hypothetical protein
MKKITLALVSCLSIAACSSASPQGDGEWAEPNILAFNDAKDASGAATATNPLVDHGGPVLTASKTFAIWWGSPSGFPSDAKAGIDNLFAGFNGSSFLGISSQYMRGSSVSSSFHTNWTDTSYPPSHVSTYTIGSEVCKEISRNGATPDSSAVYFVYTSNFPRGGNYCAWHSWGYCGNTPVQIAYMPNTTGVAGCDPGNLYNCNSYSQGTRSLANVTSHEFMESVTDPELNAWYDNGGSEIGDKCAWNFSSCVNLPNGSWQLQTEWSNTANGCVQQ